MQDNNVGKKFDAGKHRYDLIPAKALHEFVGTLTFGASKYGDENWRNVENHRARYFAAAMRHLWAWWRGQTFDEEGQHHLASVCSNVFFLLEKDLERINEQTTQTTQTTQTKE